MIELRFHGRGGQGTVIASKLLASAFYAEGKHVHSFAHYGAERRGAPVEAFVRVDTRPIRLRSLIYEPDCVVVLDAYLVEIGNVTKGLKRGGWLLINTPEPPEAFSFEVDVKVATVDADSIALAHGLGTRTAPIVNTAIVGALARCTALVGLKSVEAAVEEVVPESPEKNRAAVGEAYRLVRFQTSNVVEGRP